MITDYSARSLALIAFAAIEPLVARAAEAPARPAPPPVENITVTADRPVVLNFVDRRVYDLTAVFGANLGFHAKLSPEATATFTLSDVLNSQREKTLILTPTLYDRTTRRQLGQVAYLGLSWNFAGAASKAGPGKSFDYGEQP